MTEQIERPFRLHLLHPGPAARSSPPTLSAAPPVQGTLALAFDLPSGVPAEPPRPDLRLVAAEESADTQLRSWAGVLAVALAEVLAGLRPAAQLVRWTDHRVARQLSRVPAAPADPRRPRPRIQVASVRIDHPAGDVTEAAVVLRHDDRVRAAALRLELRRDRWICTAATVG
jgi:hypothetical protein